MDVQVKVKINISPSGDLTLNTEPSNGNHALCTSVHRSLVKVMEHNGGEIQETDLVRGRGHDDRDIYVGTNANVPSLNGDGYADR